MKDCDYPKICFQYITDFIIVSLKSFLSINYFDSDNIELSKCVIKILNISYD